MTTHTPSPQPGLTWRTPGALGGEPPPGNSRCRPLPSLEASSPQHSCGVPGSRASGLLILPPA